MLIPGIEKELSRPHVTRYLSWQEYRESHPDGYGYSQSCFHLDQVVNARKPGSIVHYNPAEKLLVDFAIHHGFVVIPTRANKPKDKAPVKNEVKIIYRRVYAKPRNHTFFP